MSAVHATLTVAAFSTELFTMLLMTIPALFQRALKYLTGPASTLVMQSFPRVVRDCYFRLNLLRGPGPGAAFILFLAGLVLPHHRPHPRRVHQCDLLQKLRELAYRSEAPE